MVRRAVDSDQAFVHDNARLPYALHQDGIAHGHVFLAEQDGTSVGFLRLGYLWSSIPYIEMIFVLETARRRGVGRSLLGLAEAELAAQGHQTIYSSSQVDEPESQAWHRRMGFAECGVLNGINEGGVGEVFFRKHVTSLLRQPTHEAAG